MRGRTRGLQPKIWCLPGSALFQARHLFPYADSKRSLLLDGASFCVQTKESQLLALNPEPLSVATRSCELVADRTGFRCFFFSSSRRFPPPSRIFREPEPEPSSVAAGVREPFPGSSLIRGRRSPSWPRGLCSYRRLFFLQRRRRRHSGLQAPRLCTCSELFDVPQCR